MFGKAHRLPPGQIPHSAAAKLAAIEEQQQEAQFVANGLLEEFQSARREAGRLQNELDQIKNPRLTTHRGSASQIAAAEAGLAVAIAARDRIGVRRDRAGDDSKAARDLLSRIEQWMSSARSVAITAHDGADHKLRKNETVSEAVERCRRRVRELRADMRAVRSAPIPSIEAKAFATAYAQSLVDAGAPDLHLLIEGGIRRIEWPDRDVQLIPGSNEFGQRPQFTQASAPAAVALAAWLQPEIFVAALHRDIDLEANDENALSADERFKRSATIAADMLATEREEEFWIENLRASGVPIERRPDADPRAVLGLASSLPAPEGSF